MPTYAANPFSNDPRIYGAAQSLADAILSGPQRRLEMQIGGAQARADLDATRAREASSYASANSANALAGKYASEKARQDMENAALAQAEAIWADDTLDYNGKMRAITGIMAQAGLTADDMRGYVSAAPAFGVDMEALDPYVYAADGNYGNTREAWMNEPVATVSPTGVPGYTAQGGLVGSGARPVLSLTEAQGLRFGSLPQARQDDVLLGRTGVQEVMGPNGPTIMPTGEAVGMAPVLSETDAKGAAMQSGQTPVAQEPWLGGTGMDNQILSKLVTISGMPREALTPELLREYRIAYEQATLPKAIYKEIPDGQGNMVWGQVWEQGRVPASLPTPDQLAMNLQGIAPAAPFLGPSLPASPGMAQTPSPLPSPGAPTAPAMPRTPPAAPTTAPPDNFTPIANMGSSVKDPTEAQARYRQYSRRILNGAGNLMALLGYDPNTGAFRENAWRPNLWDAGVMEYAPRLLQPYLLDRNAELYKTTVAQTLNPLIRADSGAAVPEGEYPRYYDQYIPLSGEDPANAKIKLDHLAVTVAAFEEVSQDPQFQQFMREADMAMAAGDEERASLGYSRAQEILHAAKFRIADELGLNIEQVVYSDHSGPGPASPGQPMGPSGVGEIIDTPFGPAKRIK